MSVLPILTYPDPILKRISRPVEEITPDVIRLLDAMVETMKDAAGVGLAAPQVGRLVRVIVADVSEHQKGTEPIMLVNPSLVQGEGEILWEEGCLSVPELTVEIPRMERLVVRGLDPSGRPKEIHAEGLLAIVLQHELDHLDGRLIVDHLSPLKRQIYRKRRLKAVAQAGN
jgi:peptide deformylase